jgi:hypothetical protein
VLSSKRKTEQKEETQLITQLQNQVTEIVNRKMLKIYLSSAFVMLKILKPKLNAMLCNTAKSIFK